MFKQPCMNGYAHDDGFKFASRLSRKCSASCNTTPHLACIEMLTGLAEKPVSFC
jgi:hypothetical protein